MYSIGELAQKASVSNRTLRYYEELGLIVPKNRGVNRYRYYDDSHVQQLTTIKLLQNSGFALKEIVAALSPIIEPSAKQTPTGQDTAKRIFAALDAQKKALITRQAELAQTIDVLSNTMKNLQECFHCTLSAALHECSSCKMGPGEVINRSLQFGNKATRNQVKN